MRIYKKEVLKKKQILQDPIRQGAVQEQNNELTLNVCKLSPNRAYIVRPFV